MVGSSLIESKPFSFLILFCWTFTGLKSEMAAEQITTSELSNNLIVSLNISWESSTLIVLIFLRSIRRFVGPIIKVTLAPSSTAFWARLYPILPDELFPIYLTGSIFSWVGPAVIKKFKLLNGRVSLILFST